MITRAPKKVPTARCCWVCGKLGGDGFTRALRNAGYDVQPDEMAYAHPVCMGRVARSGDRESHNEAWANNRMPTKHF